MESNNSSEIPDISYSSDSNISSNAEELQMLEKLKINENVVISNEKEMQKKIIEYEQKIRELQEELNSQGSSDLNKNIVDNHMENKFSNSFASQSSKSENLEFISNSFNESRSEKIFNQQINPANRIQINQFNDFNVFTSNYSEKYNYRLHLINDFEQFVNTKITEADQIMNSLLYPECKSCSPLPIVNVATCNLHEQNIRLKSELNELKKSLYRYLNRHEEAKRKREAKENFLNQKIAFLEEREKDLAQIIEMQQKS